MAGDDLPIGEETSQGVFAQPPKYAVHSIFEGDEHKSCNIPGASHNALMHMFQSSPAPEDGRYSRHSNSLNYLGFGQRLRDSFVT